MERDTRTEAELWDALVETYPYYEILASEDYPRALAALEEINSLPVADRGAAWVIAHDALAERRKLLLEALR